MGKAALPPSFKVSPFVAHISLLLLSLYRPHAEQKMPGSPDTFQRFLDRTVAANMPEFDRTTWAQHTNIYWLKEES